MNRQNKIHQPIEKCLFYYAKKGGANRPNSKAKNTEITMWVMATVNDKNVDDIGWGIEVKQ